MPNICLCSPGRVGVVVDVGGHALITLRLRVGPAALLAPTKEIYGILIITGKIHLSVSIYRTTVKKTS